MNHFFFYTFWWLQPCTSVSLLNTAKWTLNRCIDSLPMVTFKWPAFDNFSRARAKPYAKRSTHRVRWNGVLWGTVPTEAFGTQKQWKSWIFLLPGSIARHWWVHCAGLASECILAFMAASSKSEWIKFFRAVSLLPTFLDFIHCTGAQKSF